LHQKDGWFYLLTMTKIQNSKPFLCFGHGGLFEICYLEFSDTPALQNGWRYLPAKLLKLELLEGSTVSYQNRGPLWTATKVICQEIRDVYFAVLSKIMCSF
jgi:hypothetical protein